jgi:hypothetical protein
MGKKPTQPQQLPAVDLLDKGEAVVGGLKIEKMGKQPKISSCWIAEGCVLELVKKESKWLLLCSDRQTGERLIPLVIEHGKYVLHPKESCSYTTRPSVFA